MTNKTLEKKVESLEKDMARLKSVIFGLDDITDSEGQYKSDFVKRVLKNAKDRHGSVKYTNKKDFLKLIRHYHGNRS